MIRKRRCSIDLRRVEFSWLPVILRLPFVQMLHGEGVPKLRMDSLLKKYSFVHHAGERFAMATSEKFLCVNPLITDRMRATYPASSDKIDTLWTWVNTDIFKVQPFPSPRHRFKIVFAGRLDEFKVPPLMFKNDRAAEGATAGPGRVSLHRHQRPAAGFRNSPRSRTSPSATASRMPPGMAATLGSAHAGILTSEFEGMPRCVLETLAVGRPVVAMHLPQLEAVIRDGQSGFLVPRRQSMDDDADKLARNGSSNSHDHRGERMDPVHRLAHRQLHTAHPARARVQLHRDIQDARGRPRGADLLKAPA